MPFLALIPLLTLRRGYEGGCIQYPSRTLPLGKEKSLPSPCFQETSLGLSGYAKVSHAIGSAMFQPFRQS